MKLVKKYKIYSTRCSVGVRKIECTNLNNRPTGSMNSWRAFTSFYAHLYTLQQKVSLIGIDRFILLNRFSPEKSPFRSNARHISISNLLLSLRGSLFILTRFTSLPLNSKYNLRTQSLDLEKSISEINKTTY